MFLEVEKEEKNYHWLFLWMKHNMQCMRDFFRGWSASGKVWPMY